MTQKQKQNYIIGKNISNETLNKNPQNKKLDTLGLIGRVNIGIVVLLLVGGFYFVMSVNDLSVKGFILKNLKIKLSESVKINKDMEIGVMQLESLENVAKRAEAMRLVKVDKVEYIINDNDVVAKK